MTEVRSNESEPVTLLGGNGKPDVHVHIGSDSRGMSALFIDTAPFDEHNGTWPEGGAYGATFFDVYLNGKPLYLGDEDPEGTIPDTERMREWVRAARDNDDEQDDEDDDDGEDD